MKANDNFIKKALQENIKRLDDNSFTTRIIDKHLAKGKTIKSRPFSNFKSMIIGLSFVIISLGMVFIVKQNNDCIKDIGFTENNALVLFTLAFIFLIYKWLEDFIKPAHRYTIVKYTDQIK